MSSLPEPAAASTIERVEVYGYELTYAHGSYAMSEGRVLDALDEHDRPRRHGRRRGGYGEVCPLGTRYLPAFAEGARAALREIGPALIGVDAANLAAVGTAMDGALLGHAYAKSPVDVACWDILGRRAGLPLYALLGGLRAASFPLYVAVPLAPVDEMARFVGERMAEGVRHFQLKLGADPHDDAARAAEVAGLVGDQGLLIADANCGWLPAGRRGRRAPARRARPRLPRAAVPDARGVRGRAQAHDPADGARRDHPRRPLAPARRLRERRWRRST